MHTRLYTEVLNRLAVLRLFFLFAFKTVTIDIQSYLLRFGVLGIFWGGVHIPNTKPQQVAMDAYKVGPGSSYKWSYSPYQWPYKRVTGFFSYPYLSHEKNNPWLVVLFVGDEILPSYIGIVS